MFGWPKVPQPSEWTNFPQAVQATTKYSGTNPQSTGTISLLPPTTPPPRPIPTEANEATGNKTEKVSFINVFQHVYAHWESAKERAVAGGSETAGNSRCVRERWWTGNTESLIRFYSPLLSPPWHKTVCKAKRNAETPDLPVSASSLCLCHEKSVKLYCFTFCHAITQLVV